jgi:chromosome partitioning protein
MPPPRVVAVANQKGGVGKSTTTLGLGNALAELGQRVAVIDLDPQCNITATVLPADPASPTFADLMLAPEPYPLESILVPTAWGFALAPNEEKLATLERDRPPYSELRLRRAIEAGAGDHDVLFIDCPPNLGLLTLNAMSAADEVLIVTQPVYWSLQGMTRLLQTVQIVRGFNGDLRIVGVIANLMTFTNEHKQRLEEVRQYFADPAVKQITGGAEVWEPVMPQRVMLAEAVGRGVPFNDPAFKARGTDVADRYRRLARRFMDERR